MPAPAAVLLEERVSGVLRSWFSSWYSGNGNFSCLSKFSILIKQNEIPKGMFPVRRRRSRSIPCCVCLLCFSGQDFSCQQHALKGDAILKGWILRPVPKSLQPLAHRAATQTSLVETGSRHCLEERGTHQKKGRNKSPFLHCPTD